MTDQQLAQHSADNFWTIQDYGPFQSDFGYSEVERNFVNEIRNESSNYQLHFLYRLQALVSNTREEHAIKCKSPDTCQETIFYHRIERSIKQKILKLNPNYDRQSLNTELVNKTLLQFKDFENALKPFEVALNSFAMGGDDRSIVDNMRLAFETFLRDKLKNNQSIENQYSALGALLKESGTSPEIMNMFVKLVDGFMKYQNENVKHSAKLKRDEVELMINLTLSFINFIASK